MAKQEERALLIESDEYRANQLALSGDYCQPEWSEKRNGFVFIKRKK